MSNSSEVRLQGVVSPRILDTPRAGSGMRADTILYGDIQDQAALHGLLARNTRRGEAASPWPPLLSAHTSTGATTQPPNDTGSMQMNSQPTYVNDAEEGLGWLVFAGTILGIAGIMRIFDALWAFRYDGAIPDELEGALLGTSLTTYGWVWLIVGVGLLLSSFAVLTRSQFARWIGIIAGAVLAITATWWMPYYPVWSFTFIIIGVLVVYGLAAHGGRISVD